MYLATLCPLIHTRLIYFNGEINYEELKHLIKIEQQ